MNDAQVSSQRRQHEISMCIIMTSDENIRKWITRRHENNTCEKSLQAIKACSEILVAFIQSKATDVDKLYEQYAVHRPNMTESEYLTLVTDTEDIIRKRLAVLRDESKERVYQQETEYIAANGYKLDKKYIISFPDTPTRADETWIVTAYRVGENNRIIPDTGKKMKKDGTPYLSDCSIHISSTQIFTMQLVEEE